MANASMSTHRYYRFGWLSLLPLLLLSIILLQSSAVANPVSSPEISSKPVKQSAGVIIQQQQQQQQTAKAQQQSQDAHLNSLTAYATSYENLPLGLHNGASATAHFKPSYKLPEMETNFTPMQGSGPPPIGSATPVIMSYMPQQLDGNGVGGSGAGLQYLQLIPTRSLIVPISPYLSAGPSGGGTQSQAAYHAVAPPQLNGGGHGPQLAEYAPRAAMLTALPPAQPPPTANLVNMPANLPYGLHPYNGGGLHSPYRNFVAGAAAGHGFVGGGYRINREIKEKHLPPGMSLNLNEYLPGPHAAAHAVFMRGRP